MGLRATLATARWRDEVTRPDDPFPRRTNPRPAASAYSAATGFGLRPVSSDDWGGPPLSLLA